MDAGCILQGGVVGAGESYEDNAIREVCCALEFPNDPNGALLLPNGREATPSLCVPNFKNQNMPNPNPSAAEERTVPYW